MLGDTTGAPFCMVKRARHSGAESEASVTTNTGDRRMAQLITLDRKEFLLKTQKHNHVCYSFLLYPDCEFGPKSICVILAADGSLSGGGFRYALSACV